LAAQRDARPVGQAPVEADEVVSGGAELQVGIDRREGDIDGMAVPSQPSGDGVGQIGLIFDN
jgi:hypothetical protein